MRSGRPGLLGVLVCGALIGIGLALAARQAAWAPEPASLPVSSPLAVVPSSATHHGLPDFRALVRALSPSVVNIATESEEEGLCLCRKGEENCGEKGRGECGQAFHGKPPIESLQEGTSWFRIHPSTRKVY